MHLNSSSTLSLVNKPSEAGMLREGLEASEAEAVVADHRPRQMTSSQPSNTSTNADRTASSLRAALAPRIKLSLA
jgi:hypothetical protein